MLPRRILYGGKNRLEKFLIELKAIAEDHGCQNKRIFICCYIDKKGTLNPTDTKKPVSEQFEDLLFLL